MTDPTDGTNPDGSPFRTDDHRIAFAIIQAMRDRYEWCDTYESTLRRLRLPTRDRSTFNPETARTVQVPLTTVVEFHFPPSTTREQAQARVEEYMRGNLEAISNAPRFGRDSIPNGYFAPGGASFDPAAMTFDNFPDEPVTPVETPWARALADTADLRRIVTNVHQGLGVPVGWPIPAYKPGEPVRTLNGYERDVIKRAMTALDDGQINSAVVRTVLRLYGLPPAPAGSSTRRRWPIIIGAGTGAIRFTLNSRSEQQARAEARYNLIGRITGRDDRIFYTAPGMEGASIDVTDAVAGIVTVNRRGDVTVDVDRIGIDLGTLTPDERAWMDVQNQLADTT